MFLHCLAILISATLLSVATADAQTLPFGLDKLHWSMSRDEARAAFAPLRNPGKGATPGLISQADIGIAPYKWRSCELNVTFTFADSGLEAIAIAPDFKIVGAHCRDAMLKEMQRFYGAATVSGPPYLKMYSWTGLETHATFAEGSTGFATAILQQVTRQ